MELRNETRKHIWHCLEDGQKTNAWHDLWCKEGPLSKFITRRQVYSAGFSNNASVASVVENGQLIFPDEWYGQHGAILPKRQLELTNGKEDMVKWRSNKGNLVKFSVNRAWKDLRSQEVKIPWDKVVWFSNFIPRHAFIVWLMIHERLPT